MKMIIMMAIALLGIVSNAMTSEETIASTLWLEACGEGRVGIDAVASVIANRAKKSGNTMAYECLRPKQFSCWNDRKQAVPQKANGEMWEYCKKVAKDMSRGRFVTTTNATHYYNPYLCNPSWGKKMTDVVVIGKHLFGKC